MISDCVDYYPDWSAAMLRRFEDLNPEELEYCFKIANKLCEYDVSQWDNLLVQWELA